MTLREELVCKLLLLVARIVAADDALAGEIKAIANAIATARYDSRARSQESSRDA